MDKTDRQVEHPFTDVFIIDIEGKLTLRRIGNICVGVIPERGEVVLAARARRVLSRQPLDERIRPVDVDGLLLKRRGDVVIPHVIGDFVPFPHGAPEYFRIQEPRLSGQEQRRPDVEFPEHVQQPPQSGPAPELALRAPEFRFAEELPENHRVEIDRKVDDDPDAAGKDESRDSLDPAGRFVLEHQRSFLHRLYSLWVNPITLQ